MPGKARGPFKDLDRRQQEALAEYLAARIDYLRAERRHTQQLLEALEAPARGDAKRIRAHAAEVLAPARSRMRAAQWAAVTEAADVDRLADLLPALLGELSRGVHVPMLAAALGLDAEFTGQLVARATPLVERLRANVTGRRAGAP